METFLWLLCHHADDRFAAWQIERSVPRDLPGYGVLPSRRLPLAARVNLVRVDCPKLPLLAARWRGAVSPGVGGQVVVAG